MIEEKRKLFTSQHAFAVLIVGVILISLVMVVISMALYHSNGTSQLDLSRPGYEEVSKKASRGKTSFDFSATGPINADSLKEFRDVYKKEAERATQVEAFGGDPLSSSSLGINDNTVEN